jgi:hypothetical protein
VRSELLAPIRTSRKTQAGGTSTKECSQNCSRSCPLHDDLTTAHSSLRGGARAHIMKRLFSSFLLGALVWSCGADPGNPALESGPGNEVNTARSASSEILECDGHPGCANGVARRIIEANALVLHGIPASLPQKRLAHEFVSAFLDAKGPTERQMVTTASRIKVGAWVAVHLLDPGKDGRFVTALRFDFPLEGDRILRKDGVDLGVERMAGKDAEEETRACDGNTDCLNGVALRVMETRKLKLTGIPGPDPFSLFPQEPLAHKFVPAFLDNPLRRRSMASKVSPRSAGVSIEVSLVDKTNMGELENQCTITFGLEGDTVVEGEVPLGRVSAGGSR